MQKQKQTRIWMTTDFAKKHQRSQESRIISLKGESVPSRSALKEIHNTTQKKSGVVTLISTTDFRTGLATRDKDGNS